MDELVTRRILKAELQTTVDSAVQAALDRTLQPTVDSAIQSALDRALHATFEVEFARLFGQLSRHFDMRFEAISNRLDAKIDRMQAQVDSVAGRLLLDEEERAALYAQINRHEGWIHHLAKQTSTKLKPA